MLQRNCIYYLLYGKQSKLTKSVRGTEAAGRSKTKQNKENRMTCVWRYTGTVELAIYIYVKDVSEYV